MLSIASMSTTVTGSVSVIFDPLIWEPTTTITFSGSASGSCASCGSGTAMGSG